MARIVYQKNGQRSQEEYKPVDDDRIERHRLLPHVCIAKDHLIIIHDAPVEVLEGVDGLLENLHYRDAAHIFHCLGIHFLKGVHVRLHELPSLGPHHIPHGHHGNDYGNDTCQPKPPVEPGYEYDRHQRNQYGSCQVGHLMCQEGMGDTCIVIYNLADAPTGMTIEEAQRHPGNPAHGFPTQVGLYPESGQMGRHQCREIKQYACNSQPCRPPGIGDDVAGNKRAARRQQFPDNQPNQDKR